MKTLLGLVALALWCSPAAHGQTNLEITLVHGSPGEAQTREQLQRLLATHDVSRWIYTRKISIDERAIPHSHPVLTLHTRHAKDDELLLSTFVHEQFHWHFAERHDATEAAIAELRTLFPQVPDGPSGGAADERSTYLHLLVCYLERQAVLQLFGELKARQVMEFWANDHYNWVYETVMERPRDIGTVVIKHKLSLPR